MAKIIFDDKRSIWHGLIGFISAFLLVFSIFIIGIYVIYQRREKEAFGFTLGDVMEFVIGYIYGLAVVVWWIYLSG